MAKVFVDDVNILVSIVVKPESELEAVVLTILVKIVDMGVTFNIAEPAVWAIDLVEILDMVVVISLPVLISVPPGSNIIVYTSG